MPNASKFLYGVDLEGAEALNTRLHQVAVAGDFGDAAINGQIGFLSTTSSERIVFTLGEAIKYVPRLDLAETVAGQWSFSPATTAAPFVLGLNAQGQLVTDLNADLLDGYHAEADAVADTVARRYSSGRLKVGAPVDGQDAVNKDYVTSVIEHREDKEPVKAATTGALPDNDFDPMDGNILIAEDDGAFPDLDGVTLNVDDPVLLLHEGDADTSDNAYKGTSHRKNGIWRIKVKGDGSTPWQLERRGDADTDLNGGATVFVNDGSINGNTKWTLEDDAALTTDGVDGDPLVWFKSAGADLVKGGNGIVKAGDTLHFAGPTSYSVGDLFYASSASAVGRLTSASTGNVLISGGAATAPSWGKVGLTTHVNGILPIANGGTNSNAALSNGRLMVSSGSAIVERAALTAAALVVGDAAAGVASLSFGTSKQMVGMNAAGNAVEFKALTVTSGGVIDGGTWQASAIGLAYGGSNADLSGVATGGLIYKGASALAGTGALSGILQGDGSSAPTAITGTTNRLPKWSSSAPYLASSIISDDGSTVTILNGNVVIERTTNGTHYLQFANTEGTTKSYSQIAHEDNGSASYMRFAGGLLAGGNTFQGYTFEGGKVGIGTTAPANELEVCGINSPRLAIRSLTEAVNDAMELGFQVGTGANNSNNTVALISAVITQATPSALKGELRFGTNSGDSLSTWWKMLSDGILESVGAQTIRTSTGALTLATGAGNGNILLTPHGTGFVRATATGGATATTLIERISQTTDTLLVGARIHVNKSTDMGAGFGASLEFDISDDAGVINPIARIGAVRGAADNTGYLSFHTISAGVDSEHWRILEDGVLEAVGAKTIRTTTGNIILASIGGNGSVILAPNGSGVVNAAGNVEVSGSATRSFTHVVGSDTAGTFDFNASGPSTASHVFRFHRSTNTTGVSGVVICKGNNSTTAQHQLYSGSNSFLCADNCNLGVGTTNPGQKLEVNGLAYTKGFLLNGDYATTGGVTGAGVFGGNVSHPDGFGTVIIASRLDAARPIIFAAYNGSAFGERWRITGAGILEAAAAQTVRAATGNLTLASNGGNGHVVLSAHGTGRYGVGSSSPDAFFDINPGTSQVRSTAVGFLRVRGGTLTDDVTSASGTASNQAFFNQFLAPTLTATNTGVTTTHAATVYISGEPVAGTNMTITNNWAVVVDSGAVRLDGNLGSTDFRVPIIYGATVNAAAVLITGLTASKAVFTDGSKNLTSSGTLGADQGGTGLTSYAVGDLIYASASTTLSKLGAVATGNVLISGGVATAPSWGKVALGTHTTGDYVATLAGTSNQVSVSGSTGAITISLPQNIHTAATPTFAGVTLSGLTASRPVFTDGSKGLVSAAYALPASVAQYDLLYASSTTQISALAKANSSVLGTNGSGVPAWITDLPSGITKGGKALVVGYSGNLAASATSYDVSHNLGSRKLMVILRDTSTGEIAHTAFTVSDDNTINVAFRVAPAAGKWDVNIVAFL